MTTMLKVRVNPNKPGEFATHSDPSDSYAPWYTHGGGYNRWVKSADVADWAEYSLAVPEPPHQFKAGDVVKVTNSYSGRIRVRDTSGNWKSMTASGSDKLDYEIRTGLGNTYELLGNVKDLAPKF